MVGMGRRVRGSLRLDILRPKPPAGRDRIGPDQEHYHCYQVGKLHPKLTDPGGRGGGGSDRLRESSWTQLWILKSGGGTGRSIPSPINSSTKKLQFLASSSRSSTHSTYTTSIAQPPHSTPTSTPSPPPMSIRRPPTALGLTASDVAELSHKLQQDRQARAQQAQAERDGQQHYSNKRDQLVERERQEREAKDRLRAGERVGI